MTPDVSSASSPPRHTERILCSLREELPAAWLPRTGGVPITWDQLAAVLKTRNIRPRFFRRGDVETRPEIKQWIPYVLLRRPDGCLACYPRQGTEQRLHGLWSVGIGGHVNVDDLGDAAGERSWNDLLQAGLRRELEEELPGFRLDRRPPCLGLIHEDETPVGSVHLGIVCLMNLAEDAVLKAGRELRGMTWLPPERLLREHPDTRRLELWSVLALHFLA